MERNRPPALANTASNAMKTIAIQIPHRPGRVACAVSSGGPCAIQVAPPELQGNTPETPSHWDSATLLGDQRSTTIVHRGEAYRLQLTRQGKLILTK